MFLLDVGAVFLSNVVSILGSIVSGFLVPKYLGVDQYAVFKTFALYTSYIGVLHFGYIDGLYLKYGGRRESEIDLQQLSREFYFLLLLEAAVSLSLLLFSVAFKAKTLGYASILVFPSMVYGFFVLYWQATGQMRYFSAINVVKPVLFTAGLLVLIFIFKTSTADHFILLQLLMMIAIAAIILFYAKSLFKGCRFETGKFRNNLDFIKVGIFITAGNASNILLYTIDRWFVKIGLSTSDFAFYSFAVSIMAMVSVFTTSISITLYHRLARESENRDFHRLIKRLLLFFSMAAAWGYFPIAFVVERLLPAFIPALPVTAILFLSFPAMVAVNALYINLYKAQKKERVYFRNILVILALSALLNTLAFALYRSSEGIALATTLTFFLWLAWETGKNEDFQDLLRQSAILALYSLAFFGFSKAGNTLVGAAGYLAFTGVMLKCFFWQDVKPYARQILGFVSKSMPRQ